MATVANLRAIGEVRGQLFGVRLVAFSDDGMQVATGDVALELALWRDQRVVFRWDMAGDTRYWRRAERIRGAAFWRDGDSLYVASGESLWCLDTGGGAIKWEHRSRGILAFLRNACLSVASLPDGTILSTYDDGKFEIRDHEGSLKARWGRRECPRFIEAVDGGRLLVGADAFASGVWDLSSHRQVARFEPHGRIIGFAASRRGPLVAVLTLDELLLWDRSGLRDVVHVPMGMGLPCLDVCPTCDLVAVADLDGVGVWDATGQKLARADAKGMRVLSVKFMPEGSTLVAGCMDGTIRAWDVGSLLHGCEPQPGA